MASSKAAAVESRRGSGCDVRRPGLPMAGRAAKNRRSSRTLRVMALATLAPVTGAVLAVHDYLHPPLVRRKSIVSLLCVGADAGGTRGDVIAGALLAPETGRTVVWRAARDCWVDSGGQRRRLNALHGTGELRPYLEQLLSRRFDRVVVLDFRSAAALVDSVSGLEIDMGSQQLPAWKEADTGWRHPLLGPGRVHVNGRDAVGIVRYRGIGNRKSSDTARMDRQQLVEEALTERVKSLLLDPAAVLAAKRCWETQVRTDASAREAAAVAWQLSCAGHAGRRKRLVWPGGYDGAGFRLDRKEFAFQRAALEYWLGGGNSTPIRVLCPQATDAADLDARLRTAGFHPFIELDPALPAGRYLSAPTGTGTVVNRCLDAAGIRCRVNESFARRSPMLVWGR